MLQHWSLFLLQVVLIFLQHVLSNPDRHCAKPICEIKPGGICGVTTNYFTSSDCPSSINPIIPDGGYRDLPGTPTDLTVERIDNTGEPIIDITWKPPVPYKDIPQVINFTIFINAWDAKDGFKRKCQDRWYTINYNKTWPKNKSITVRLSCPFFYDKWLFVFVNSVFNNTSPCLLRQARFRYKSTDTPVGLGDYRIKMHPHGRDGINVNFEPLPGTDHVVLWCTSGDNLDCSSTDCQRTYLKPGYGDTVFHSIEACNHYTLKICPQVPLHKQVISVTYVYIPMLEFSTSLTNSKISMVPSSTNIQPTTLSLMSSSLTHQSKESPDLKLSLIIVGCILVLLALSLMIYYKYRTGTPIRCFGHKLRFNIRRKIPMVISSVIGNEEDLNLVNDCQTIPVFYYPDSPDHLQKINWWINKIQTKSTGNFKLKLYSVTDQDFYQMIWNFSPELDIYSVLFIVNSKCLHTFLPYVKFKPKSSPKKQTVIQFLKERHNKVFILDLGLEDKRDLEDIQVLLDLDNIIHLNEGAADNSIQQILVMLNDQNNQTFSKKLDPPEPMDDGYYSGDKFDNRVVNCSRPGTPGNFFFPPDTDEAISEHGIFKELEAINQRCSRDYECTTFTCVDPAYKSEDTLSL